MGMVRFNLFVDPAERALWEAAARADGRSLSAWLRCLANRAVAPWRLVESEDGELIPRQVVEPEPDPVVEHVKLSDMPPVPKPKGNPPLCGRCSRVGQPSCPECRKAWGLA